MKLFHTKLLAIISVILLSTSIFLPSFVLAVETPSQTINLESISDLERLNLAKYLLENDQADKSIQAIVFKKFSEVTHIIIAENLLADSLFALGRKAEAIDILRKLLAVDPSLTITRYKLAQMLFATEDDMASKHHFQILRNSIDDDASQNTINQYLKQMDLRKRWFFNMGGSVLPQSNFNGGSSKSLYFCEDTASTKDGIAAWTKLLASFGLDCTVGIPISATEQAQSGIVASGNISGGYRFRLAENASWTVRASGEYTRYPGVTPDAIALAFTTGPTISLGNATKLDITGTASISISDKSITQKHYGISATFDHVFNPQILGNLSLGVSKTQSLTNNDYSNFVVQLNAAAQISLDNSSFIRVLGGVARAKYVEPNLSYWQVSSGLGYYKEFAYGITVYSQADLAYKAKPLEATTTFNFSTKLTKRDFSFLGFTPQLIYNYNRADSNINRNDTDAHSISIGITRSF